MKWVKDQSGQIVIEYVLLLIVVVAIATLLTRELVSRNPDKPGALVAKWQRILVFVAEDLPEVITPPKN